MNKKLVIVLGILVTSVNLKGADQLALQLAQLQMQRQSAEHSRISEIQALEEQMGQMQVIQQPQIQTFMPIQSASLQNAIYRLASDDIKERIRSLYEAMDTVNESYAQLQIKRFVGYTNNALLSLESAFINNSIVFELDVLIPLMKSTIPSLEEATSFLCSNCGSILVEQQEDYVKRLTVIYQIIKNRLALPTEQSEYMAYHEDTDDEMSN